MSHDAASLPVQPSRRPFLRRALRAQGILLGAYLVVAYAIMPAGWRWHSARQKAAEGFPRITHTASGIHGDPVNMALVGTKEDVIVSMMAAGWHPADPITLRSSLRIARCSVFRRPYQDAPVSDLFLFGRKQDLAFQQAVGNSPRQRHHVRYWRVDRTNVDGRPFWAGAATFDSRVGLSHTTMQITHHIAADVDADRNLIIEDLRKAGRMGRLEWVDDFHQKRDGHNGGGDPWHTDGRLAVLELVPVDDEDDDLPD